MDPVLVLDEQRLQVEPGGEVRVTLTVRNLEDVVAECRLEVLGDAARWSEVVPRHISFIRPARQEQNAEIVFRPPPPPLTVAGEVPFGVRCVSLEDPDRCSVVEGDLVVGAVHGVQARLEPVSPAGRWSGRYRTVFENTGSVPVRLRLGAADPRRMLGFAVAPQELTVEPGRSAPGYVKVRPRQPMLRGRPAVHAFAVTYQTARDGQPPGLPPAGAQPTSGGELPASFEQRPVLSRGAMVAALALVLVVAGIAALLTLRGGDDEVEPTAGPPPPIGPPKATRLTDTSVQLIWQHSPYATGYLAQQLLSGGTVAKSEEVKDRDQSALAWTGLRPGNHCFRILVVGEKGRSAPSEPACVEVTKVPPALAARTSGGSPPPSGPPQPGRDPSAGGPQSSGGPAAGGPTGGPNQPPPGRDPIQGYFVIYVPPTPVADDAARGIADGHVARLQAAGAQAQLLDSRDTEQIGDGKDNGGLWVIVKDGFPDYAAARKECDAYKDLAPVCQASRPLRRQ